MIRVFHAARTRSIRVIWACEELGLSYTVDPVDFSIEYRATPEWRAMNPVGKVPVMIDEAVGGGLKLFESGAMVQYLIDRYGNGRFQPTPGTDAHGVYLQWGWFAESTFARPLGEIVNHRRVFPAEEHSAAAISEMMDRAWLCVEALDRELTTRDYLTGEFSGADIMTGYSLYLTDWLVERELPPAVAAYWQRLGERPALKKALAY